MSEMSGRARATLSSSEVGLTRLANWQRTHAACIAVGQIEEAGFTLPATFARPHYTLRLRDASHDEVERLLAALGPPRENPYHSLVERRARREPR